LANDIDTLPLALKLSKGRKVIFDAHEYAPREFEDSLFWRIFFQRYKTFLCRVYIPRVSGMTTVCQGIADTYKKETGIEPMVVTNAPDFEDIGPNLLLEEGRNIRLVYHGGAMPSRKIENMIRMMDFLDGRFELNLILTVSDHHYNERLKRLAERKPNIHFLPPVPMRILPKYLNQYDIGVYILEPTNFNNLYALPNKFFEFIQARLAIAVSPSPEMARIVQSHELGVVAQDYTPEALAHRLLALDRQKIDYYKLRSHTVARILSAEQNKKILLSLISRVLEE
jgi:glycosyltransferase involved in cell wall biosynthesis